MTPRGLGVYCGRSGLTPARARVLAAARVRHVALCCEAVDGWRASSESLAWHGAVVRAAGMTPHVYAFPGAARARTPVLVAEALCTAAVVAGAATAILDAEAPYRGRPVELRETLAAMARAWAEDMGAGYQPYALASTTLGLPSDGGRWPWAELQGWSQRRQRVEGDGWLGWQCYERAASQRARAGLLELRATWGAGGVLPHLASYARRTATPEGLDGADRLAADLRRACLDERGVCDVPGVWLWSAASLDAGELAVLRAWADGYGWQ